MKDTKIYTGLLLGVSLLAIGATLLVLNVGRGLGNIEEPGSQMTYEELYDQAWDDACRLSRYVCGTARRPAVMYTPLTSANGQYFCGHDVILDDNEDPMFDHKSYAVLVHENVHFLQIKIHGVSCPFTSSVMRCLYEREASDIMTTVYMERGGKETLPDFYNMYGCPRE